MSIEEAMEYYNQGFDVVHDADKGVTKIIDQEGKTIKVIKD